MSDSHEFLRSLALVLGVAAAAAVLCRRFRQPVVFGYLVAGMVVGPNIPIPLVADAAMVRTLSELGVILLMFALGLEFSLGKLAEVGKTATFVAVLQSSALTALGYLIGRRFGWTALESLFAGAVIAISSTTIIVKAFAEQRIVGPFREIVFGILVIEDLIAIVLLALLTALSVSGSVSVADLGATAFRLAAFLVTLVVVGLLLVPRFVRFVLGFDRPDVAVVAFVGLSFGAAYLAAAFGYSVALGAFLAGAVIAESGREEEVFRMVEPVRDVFAAIFFVAVGMLIDPRLVAEHWLAVVVLTAAVIVGKVLAVSLGAFLTGAGVRTSVQAGMSLSQIGEFSFIIAGVGLATGGTRPFLYPVAVAVSAITTLTTPWLIRAAGPVASYVDRTLPTPLQTIVGLYGSWMGQLRSRRPEARERSRGRRALGFLLLDGALIAAIVAGAWIEFGPLTGWLQRSIGLSAAAARGAVLVAAGALAVPFGFGLVRHLRALVQAAAHQALPGPDGEALDRAVAPRRALAVTWQFAVVALLAIPLIALADPLVPAPVMAGILALVLVALGIAFWRSATNLQGHALAGAEVIVAALERELTGARQASAHAPPTPAGASRPTPDRLSQLYDLIPGLGDPQSFRIEAGARVAGRTLAQLDLRDLTGATVLAIVRGGDHLMLPRGREALRAGDLVALAGTPEAVEAAKRLLAEPNATEPAVGDGPAP